MERCNYILRLYIRNLIIFSATSARRRHRWRQVRLATAAVQTRRRSSPAASPSHRTTWRAEIKIYISLSGRRNGCDFSSRLGRRRAHVHNLVHTARSGLSRIYFEKLLLCVMTASSWNGKTVEGRTLSKSKRLRAFRFTSYAQTAKANKSAVIRWNIRKNESGTTSRFNSSTARTYSNNYSNTCSNNSWTVLCKSPRGPQNCVKDPALPRNQDARRAVEKPGARRDGAAATETRRKKIEIMQEIVFRARLSSGVRFDAVLAYSNWTMAVDVAGK